MIDRHDRGFVLLVSLLTLVVAIFPFAIGQTMAPKGSLYYGNRVVAPADFSIYYSYITQGATGKIFMDDAFTSERYAPTIFQPLWYVVGLGARLTHVDAPTAFAAARYLTIPIFLLALWWAASWLWPEDRQRRRVGFVISIIASGVGGLTVTMLPTIATENLWQFPDLWVSEAYSMLTLWSSAHFLLVSSGILFILIATERSFLEQRWRWAVWAGIVALGVVAIHPFHVLTWFVCWVVLTVWRWITSRQFPWRYIIRWSTVLLISSPMLLMYLLQLLSDPYTIGRAVQNINMSDAPWRMAIGIGAPLVCAIWSTFYWRPRDDRWRWLLAVAAGYCIAIYLPVAFQRRLSQGMLLPFSWLSVPAAVWLVNKTRHWSRATAFMTIGSAALLLSSTWIIVGGLIIKDFAIDVQVPRRMYFLDQEHQALYAALRNTDPLHPMLGTLIESNVAAGLTAHKMFIGYGVETLRFGEKWTLMTHFYTDMAYAQQRTMLQQERLCYVLDSPRTRAYGNAFQPAVWPDLALVWSGPTMALYQTPFCS